MVKIFKHLHQQGSRLYLRYGLLFLLLAILAACTNNGKGISLIYKGKLAVGIQIPKSLLKTATADSLKVLRLGATTAILGSFTSDGDEVLFEPLIPLTPGSDYQVSESGKLIGHITVPASTGQAPVLIATYPGNDTIPENTLKIYFQFSQPMRTGEVLEHVHLLDQNRDTLRNVFLNLQPELWDTTGKILTLWLDPGRIKRGLVLNRALGNPLKTSQTYTLVVSKDWKDSRGINLARNYTRQFVADQHDGTLPDINTWKLNLPKAGTDQPLIITSPKSLDHFLFAESVGIFNEGKMMYSLNRTDKQDKILKITPIAPWEKKRYTIRVLARLEDLAGNNLNRVFDRDLTKDKQQNREYFERTFSLK